MAKKKNKQIYNPRYAALYGNIGQSMRQGSSEELRAQERSNINSNIHFNPEFTSEYYQTGGPDYYQPITPSDTTVDNDSDSNFLVIQAIVYGKVLKIQHVHHQIYIILIGRLHGIKQLRGNYNLILVAKKRNYKI